MENTNAQDKEYLNDLLDRLSGILDHIYLCVEDKESCEYINKVESDLHTYLKQKGMI